MVTSILEHQQYMFGVRSLLKVEKMLLVKNVLTMKPAISIFSARRQHYIAIARPSGRPRAACHTGAWISQTIEVRITKPSSQSSSI